MDKPGLFRRLLRKLRQAPSSSLELVFNDQLSRLRHEVRNHRRIRDVRTILVTSAVPGEGKTTVACGLARSFAASLDYRALLVETDLRHPSIAPLFGLDPHARGLSDYILGAADLSEVIQRTADPKLSVITAGALQRPAAALIGSDQMRRAVAEMRERYPDRIVIFDAPPIAPTPEPLSLSVLVDGVILVVRAEETSRILVERAVRALPPEKLLGAVVNCVRLGRDERSYYGPYYEATVVAGSAQPAS